VSPEIHTLKTHFTVDTYRLTKRMMLPWRRPKPNKWPESWSWLQPADCCGLEQWRRHAKTSTIHHLQYKHIDNKDNIHSTSGKGELAFTMNLKGKESGVFCPLMPTVAMGTAKTSCARPSSVIFDIRALWRSALSVRVPGCQKLQMTVWHRMLYSSTHMATVGVKGLDGVAADIL